MKKMILSVVIIFCFSAKVFSQKHSSNLCWQVSDSIDKFFFRYLFTSITDNNPELTEVKLDVSGSSKILLVNLMTFVDYYKMKNNIPDSLAKQECKKALMKKYVVPIEDTAYFKRWSANSFNKVFFEDSLLNKYRKMGIREFMLRKCAGRNILGNELSSPLIAYFYENRILWDNTTFHISRLAMAQIERNCKIKWNTEKKRWENTSVK